MGFLTPILVRNDGVSELEKYPEEAAQKILYASMEHQPQSITVGHHVNVMKSLGTAHADVPRTIVVYGNTWLDLDQAIRDLQETNVPVSYVKNCLDQARSAIKRLEKALKKVEK